MIQLLCRSLPAQHRRTLTNYQKHVNAGRSFPERVERARSEFSKRNRPANRTFQIVKGRLDEMCSGVRRCCYCEDSAADEVEHVRPKNLYPGNAFVWSNYVYACGPCNGPKSDKWAVLDRAGRARSVVRLRGVAPEPPPRGMPALINPRNESGLDFMELDLLGTYLFVPSAPSGTVAYARAEYTIRILHLNDRDYLPRARRAAYRDFLAHLRAYVAEKSSPTIDPAIIAGYAADVARRQHPSVWAEMKRQHGHIPELTRLFAVAPEALGW